METPKKPKPNMSMVPFVAISFSMIAFAIVAILLLLSISSLKKQNEALAATVKTMEENSALAKDVEAMKAQLLALQNADALNESREEALAGVVDGLKARMDTPADAGLAVASFELKFISNPGYAYQSYTGTGMVSATDKTASHLVLLKKTLKSGGAPTTKQLEYMLVLVVDGAGTFYTDDSAEGTVVKPEYEFAIVGSTRLDSGEKTGQ